MVGIGYGRNDTDVYPGETTATSRAPEAPPQRKAAEPKGFCGDCGERVRSSDRFCAQCGKATAPPKRSKNSCVCGMAYGPKQKFCVSCGKQRPTDRVYTTTGKPAAARPRGRGSAKR